MPGQPHSTARRRHVAKFLYDLRESKKITLATAGRLLDRSPSSLSMIENARQAVRPRDLQQILYAYGVDMASPEACALLELARQDLQKGWWQEFADRVSPAAIDACSLEYNASRIRQISLGAVCGLLQTEDYARAIINNPLRRTGEADLERYVEFRMARQRSLYGSGTEYHAVLSEAVLRGAIGDRKTMRAQLLRILEISEDPCVTIQVHTLTSEFTLGVSHSLLSLAHSDLQILLFEHAFDRQFVEDPAQVARYADTFALVSRSVLSPAASAEFIRGIVSDL